MSKHTLLLASKIGDVIGKFSFVFPKAPDRLKIVCIPTAANVYEDKPWLEEEKQPFRNMGFNLSDFDIENKSAWEVEGKLTDADVVYITGGNTYYLLEKMKACGFEKAIRKCLDEGAIYVGSSAGAIVAGPSIDFIRDMDDPTKARLDDFAGLNLIDFKILPHIDHPKYGPKAQAIAAEIKSAERVLGLRDNQAVLISGGYIEIY